MNKTLSWEPILSLKQNSSRLACMTCTDKNKFINIMPKNVLITEHINAGILSIECIYLALFALCKILFVLQKNLLVISSANDFFHQPKFSQVSQGCALEEPGGPWCPTFVLGRLKNAGHTGFHKFRALGSLQFFLEHSLASPNFKEILCSLTSILCWVI